MRLHKTCLSIGLLATCALAAPAAFADEIQYAVTVDTSSQNGNYGYIDLQFNPSGLPTQTAFADVTNFSTDGTLETFSSDPNDGAFGDVSGTLPGNLTFDNLQTTNDYTQGITFGNTITFDVDLFGPGIDSPDATDFPGGSAFVLDFINSSFSGFLFTSDPTDINEFLAGTVDLNPDGSTTAANYPSFDGGTPVVTLSGPTTVPEPSMGLLLAGGLAAIAALRRRRAS